MFGNKVVRAGSWVLLGVVASQIIRLGSNLFLTRFLLPEAFGLMAIAFSLIAGISMLSDIGINANIIQSERGASLSFLRTAWTVQIIRGGVICLGVVVLAAILYTLQSAGITPDGSVYSDPSLLGIVLALSVIPLLQGGLSVNFHVAERNIDQRRRVILELISSLVPIPVMAGLILLSPSVWVLVIGALFGELLKVSLSHWIFRGPENRFQLEREAVRSLISFGKWILLSSLLGFLALQGDKLLLGGLLSAEQLGWYAIAGLFIAAAEQIIRRFQSSIGFPLIAEQARVGRDAFVAAYYKFRLYFDPLILIAGGILFALGQNVVDLLYTEKYQNAGWMLQILAVRIMLLVYASQGQAFLAQGRPKVLSTLILVRVLTMFIALPLAHYWWSLEAVVWSIALAPIPGVIFCFCLFARNKWLRLGREILILPLGLFGFAIGYAALYVWNSVAESLI